MLYKIKDNNLEKMDFYNFADIGLLEKNLENLISENLEEIFNEEMIIPIFQERQWQAEPDIIGVNKDGDIVIFELKREVANDSVSHQILRYTDKYGRYDYKALNNLWKTYCNENKKDNEIELREKHKESFGLEKCLEPERFNVHQKMIIVGNSLDIKLINSIDYWKEKGLDIDFIPYRLYKINEEYYFEFFSKDYDYHLNPKDKKAIIFDTNRTYEQSDIWYMFDNNRISAFSAASRFIDSFNKGDIVLYYHIGFGIVAAGEIISNTKRNEGRDESYRDVKLLTKIPETKDESNLVYISPSELKSLLNKNFYFASTIKSPFISIDEANILIEELNKKTIK